MNPLQKKQVRRLEELGCADLARKVDEIVDFLSPDCEHKKKKQEIIDKYRPGQWLLVCNGDSQRYWDLDRECTRKHGLKRGEWVEEGTFVAFGVWFLIMLGLLITILVKTW